MAANKTGEQALPLRGVLHFYSETGTEGGYWAFQDERFIRKDPTGYVFGGQRVWDQMNREREGLVQSDDVEVLRNGEWLPLPDPMQSDPDYFISSLFRGEKNGDHEADRRLMEKYDFIMIYPSRRMIEEMNERFGEGNWHIDKESID